MSESRKNDHIELSFSSVPDHKIDTQSLAYEPLLCGHPENADNIKTQFLGFDFDMPLWISSMTGGAQKANRINKNLAKACGEFKIGMGLGSCRPLLNDDSRIDDFDIKHHMPNQPLFTNFGIAQLEALVNDNALHKINDINHRLNADGVIIHINPLQEWCQKEGDRYKQPPIETIKRLCDNFDHKIIVKEVGQGMGPQSLNALMKLPISAIELAGYGGTNFSILEQRRHGDIDDSLQSSFAHIGQTPQQMIAHLNNINIKTKTNKTIEIIISGGIKDPVTAHILNETLQFNSVIGMAGAVLKHAMNDYGALHDYLSALKESLSMAKSFIR